MIYVKTVALVFLEDRPNFVEMMMVLLPLLLLFLPTAGQTPCHISSSVLEHQIKTNLVSFAEKAASFGVPEYHPSSSDVLDHRWTTDTCRNFKRVLTQRNTRLLCLFGCERTNHNISRESASRDLWSVFILAPLGPGRIVIAGGTNYRSPKGRKPRPEGPGGMGFLGRGQPQLPQPSPSRNRIWCNLVMKTSSWWQLSSDYMTTRPQFSTFVRKITLIIDISSIPT